MTKEEGETIARYIAAYTKGYKEALEEFYDQAARNADLERGIFFYHLYQETNKDPVPARITPAELQEAVLTLGWEYAEEGEHVYAMQSGVPIYLGPLPNLLGLAPTRLLEWLLARDRGEALRSPARSYVGMSYRVEDERLLRLLPLALRPWQEQVEYEKLASGVKRVFFTYPAMQIASAIYLVEYAFELLMYRCCVIDGYAHGPDLQRVQADTLVEGEIAQ
jgi:hypothetical protein